ncbi:MAG: dTDP-4-dehydrorhamnose reductase [Candidatus Doudnabacteria bacterium]|nr:dTDP-4-dehydrorhamnose reductase [Candidatus Doudnabacteria bacterium]
MEKAKETTVILGSKGMLGGALMRVFGSQAVGLDRQDLDFAQIKNQKSKIKNFEPSRIINCTAYNNVDGAESNEAMAFAINGQAVSDLAGLCKELGVPLVHFSTNYVFDGKRGEYKEEDLPNPQSAYAESKYAGERAVVESGCKFYLIRTSVLFGPKGESPLSKKSFVELMLDLGKRSNTAQAIHDEINSITYAVDLAERTKLLFEQAWPYGVYHITNSGQGSWYDIAAAIFKTVKPGFKIEKISSKQFGRRAARRPAKSVLLNTKLPPLRPWQDALKEYLSADRF